MFFEFKYQKKQTSSDPKIKIEKQATWKIYEIHYSCKKMQDISEDQFDINILFEI